MNDKQIKQFVNKIVPPDLEECFVEVKNVDPYLARILTHRWKDNGEIAKYEILLNESSLGSSYITRNKYRYLKATLLHEIGHAVTGRDRRGVSGTDLEIKAHLWGIDRANEMGMIAVAKEMIKIFEKWSWYGYNSKFRRYVMANKKVMSNKKLVKKYGFKNYER